MREIRLAQRRLEQLMGRSEIQVLPLHGRLDAVETGRALAPHTPGARRIVLATTIAQTSITIDGVTTVVDSGRQRAPRRDSATGWSRLATVPVSRATADQRTGRAGRTAPGHSIRLWSPTDERAMAERDRPEVLDGDLADLVLRVARWGTPVEHLR